MMCRVSTRDVILFLALVSVLCLSAAQLVQAADVNEPRFDKEGNLLRPGVAYREWIYVGTPRV